MATVDLSLIYKLTNVNDVNRLLHETVAKERAVDLELDRQLSKRSDLERNFLLLNTPTAEVLCQLWHLQSKVIPYRAVATAPFPDDSCMCSCRCLGLQADGNTGTQRVGRAPSSATQAGQGSPCVLLHTCGETNGVPYAYVPNDASSDAYLH